MESADATPRAVAYSALLHLGIVAFLALAMLNCTHWESVADVLHLPESMRPVTCTRVVQLQGPIIEATLVGPVGAPPPPASKHAQKASPKHEEKAEPKPKPPPPAPVRVLPTPVPQPKLKDQEKVAEIAEQKAEQAMTGQAGTSNDAYIAALQNAITQNWLRPDNIPVGVVCPVEIKQIPGGQVVSATVLPSCPFNDVARASVEHAVLRSSPLPYKGFEKQFSRDIIFNFTVTSSQ